MVRLAGGARFRTRGRSGTTTSAPLTSPRCATRRTHKPASATCCWRCSSAENLYGEPVAGVYVEHRADSGRGQRAGQSDRAQGANRLRDVVGDDQGRIALLSARWGPVALRTHDRLAWRLLPASTCSATSRTRRTGGRSSTPPGKSCSTRGMITVDSPERRRRARSRLPNSRGRLMASRESNCTPFVVRVPMNHAPSAVVTFRYGPVRLFHCLGFSIAYVPGSYRYGFAGAGTVRYTPFIRGCTRTTRVPPAPVPGRPERNTQARAENHGRGWSRGSTGYTIGAGPAAAGARQ